MKSDPTQTSLFFAYPKNFENLASNTIPYGQFRSLFYTSEGACPILGQRLKSFSEATNSYIAWDDILSVNLNSNMDLVFSVMSTYTKDLFVEIYTLNGASYYLPV